MPSFRTAYVGWLAGASTALLGATGCAQLFDFDQQYVVAEDAGIGRGGAGGAAAGAGGAGGGNGSVPMSFDIIDDMEDRDGTILNTGGRRGTWYWTNDTTGTQDPPATSNANASALMAQLPAPRGTSLVALHTSGSGFTDWGAHFGFHLNEGGGATSTYDASKYKGIAFWARSDAAMCRTLTIGAQDVNTDPAGGKCSDAAKQCWDDYHKPLIINQEWTLYVVPFSDLHQEGFGVPSVPALTTSQLFSFQFEVPARCDFNVWIDDVAFYR